MCVQFVMKFAPGARSLRFVRKLPLLKAIPDNILLSIASRMAIEDYSVSLPLPSPPPPFPPWMQTFCVRLHRQNKLKLNNISSAWANLNACVMEKGPIIMDRSSRPDCRLGVMLNSTCMH